MKGLLAVVRAIDAFTWLLSRIAVLLILLAALLSASNAFFRYSIEWIIGLKKDYPSLDFLQDILSWYTFNSNAFLEMQWYMFTALVMLGAPYTLKLNEHVRVDLVYGSVSERTRTWIDLWGGILCLLPFCVWLALLTWPWFVDAMRTGEASTNAGGLLRWPVKFLVPFGFGLMFLQGISEVIKCIAYFSVGYQREHAYERPVQ